MSYAITLGDAGPPMPIKLGATGFALQNTDVCILTYEGPDGVTRMKAVSNFDLATNRVRVEAWDPGDLPVAGVYFGKVTVSRVADPTYPRSFPNRGRASWVVRAP